MKYYLVLAGALAAASLVACQPASAPDASEPAAAGAEAPANAEAASTAQPASETAATGTTTAFPSNCPLIAARNWEARSRLEHSSPWIDLTGEVDITSAYYDPVSALHFPSEPGAREARFVLQMVEGPPGADSHVVRTTPVRGLGTNHEGYTRAIIVCGDGIIATIPIRPAAP